MPSTNEAVWDRTLRVALGVGMLIAGGLGVVPRPWNLALVLFAVFPLITGLSGWCPIYILLGYRTDRRGRPE